MKKVKIVSYGVVPYVMQGGKRHYLIIHQTSGSWGFPKGHTEAGETPPVTAARELLEETGISAELDTTRRFDQHYKVGLPLSLVPKMVGYFVARAHSTQVFMQPDEVQDYAWLTLEAAMERIDHRNSRDILSQADAHLKQAQT